MQIEQALSLARAQLAILDMTSPHNVAFEADILLAAVLNKSRAFLHAWPNQILSPTEQQKFFASIERRCLQEPIAYIIGKREFWSLELEVNSATLIPRPETELLVATLLSLYPVNDAVPHSVADLGTGSGAIALAIANERPAWQIDATDVSQSALQIANKNAQQLKLNNVSFYLGNWCTALPGSRYDAIFSNPPYIAETEWELYASGLAFEPRSALVSGPDGLEAIRMIIDSARYHLCASGWLLLEHGYWQGAAVRALLVAAGFEDIHTECDLLGHERVSLGKRRFIS